MTIKKQCQRNMTAILNDLQATPSQRKILRDDFRNLSNNFDSFFAQRFADASESFKVLKHWYERYFREIRKGSRVIEDRALLKEYKAIARKFKIAL